MVFAFADATVLPAGRGDPIVTALLGACFRKIRQTVVPAGILTEFPLGSYFAGKVNDQDTFVYLSQGGYWGIAIRTAQDPTGPARDAVVAAVRATFGCAPEDFDRSVDGLLPIADKLSAWIRGEPTD